MTLINVPVFVSSTWLDLQPECKAVEKVLQQMRETTGIGMEYVGSHDETAQRVSVIGVEGSRIYLGIFGGRYGTGITESEYRRAQEIKLPCLIYFRHEDKNLPEWNDLEPDRIKNLAALKAELRLSHNITEFTNSEDLSAKVTADLYRWLFEEYWVPILDGATKGIVSQPDALILLNAIKDVCLINPLLLTRLKDLGLNIIDGQGALSIGRNVKDAVIYGGVGNTFHIRDENVSRKLKKTKVPKENRWLLPYLCDRSEQEDVLSYKFGQYQHDIAKPHRPFLCVFYGNEEECHNEFIDRLKLHSLPALLKQKPFEIPLDWPEIDHKHNDLQKIILRRLGLHLKGRSNVSVEEIHHYFSLCQVPILLSLSLASRNFANSGDSLVSSFIKFWNDLPDLVPDSVLIVCISLKRQNKISQAHTTRTWWQWRRWRRRDAEEDLILKFVNTLRDCNDPEKIDSFTYGNLTSVILPELKSVPQEDVDAWSRRKEVEVFCKIPGASISELYRNLCTHNSGVSMSRLAKHLDDLIIKHAH